MSSGKRTFHHWPGNYAAGAIVAVIVFSLAPFLIYHVVVQRSWIGGIGTFVFECSGVYFALLQWRFWRYEVMAVAATDRGLSGKPLLGPYVEIPWSELTEVITNKIHGVISTVHTEIRGRNGQIIRVGNVALLGWNDLLGLIEQRAPQAHINVERDWRKRLGWVRS